MPSPFDQSPYQVRFERGAAGMDRLAATDVVVFADPLGASMLALGSVRHGEAGVIPLEEDVRGIIAAASGAIVLAGGLNNASAVADAILAEQVRRGGRVSVALVAAASPADGRIPVENDLAAGAVIDALAAHGIDHSSPEAAVVGEGFRALRRALRHMITASGSGRQMEQLGRAGAVLPHTELDTTDVVPVLRDGVFVRL